MDQPTLSIVIPVLNEAETFPQLWNSLSSSIRSQFRAFIVYDSDDDTTIPAVEAAMRDGETRLQLVRNSAGRGVIGAILTGFDQVSSGPVLVVMGDLSDDLNQVERMLELYNQGYHLVAGSRYMRGGRIENGPWLKQGLSRLAGLTLHWFRGLPTHDATNAFKIYDRAMLRAIPVASRGGFELSLEITVKAFLAGYKIAEVPSIWRERTSGESKFRLWTWLPQYLRWYLYAFQPRRRSPDPRAEVPRGKSRAETNV